ncbi:pentapeptide repeat-containing protein [Dapis sp. BLCC M229]|uniref:pentapeptide repeat-containing protein n=1 Tax=Dapis sp. BLCC M229 TaxID=3400188 RepID=UPI003CE68946
MPQDFSFQSLCGYSFKGQDLTGADFSHSDIRGTDFSNTLLCNAKFTDAKAGVPLHYRLGLVIISLLLSAISGLTAVLTAVFTGYLLFPYSISSDNFLASVIVLLIFVLFLTIAIRKGLQAAFGTVLIAGALLGTIMGTMTGTVAGVAAGAVTATLTVTIVAVMTAVLTTVLAMAGTVAGLVAGVVAIAANLAGARVGATIGIMAGKAAIEVLNNTGTIPGAKLSAVTGATNAAMAGTLAGSLLAAYLAWRALAKEPKFAWIRKIAITFAAMGGTNFRGADLTDADFSHSTLPSTNLRGATLTRTLWHKTQKLDCAILDNTILASSKIRDLLVIGNGRRKSYVGANLRGVNLMYADLSYANLRQADLSEATLKKALLESANLTEVQAIATNFTGAKLTGACIENWNIDAKTQLNEVECRFIYLEETPQSGANNRERRPHSGEFQPGEFTKLFQKVLDTIDLIFRNGVDWKAFCTAFKQMQVENEGIELAIRDIEHKGDGIIVIKVDVPANTDKAKIDTDFYQKYELALKAIEEKYQAELKSRDEQITIYRQHHQELTELAQILASRPVNTRPFQTEQKSVDSKLVTLKFSQSDLRTNFPVTLQIGTEKNRPVVECTGELPPASDILNFYDQWKSAYRRSINVGYRLDVPETQVTNVSRQEFLSDCYESAQNLKIKLNQWLNSEQFRPVKEELLATLNTSDSIRLLLQTENDLWRIPWHLWDFFDRYPQAEVALSTSIYKSIDKSIFPQPKVKILAILGDTTGIDVQKDRRMLEQLPDVAVTFLVEPQRKQLNDQLWAQPWKIFFFAGHSASSAESQTGRIAINPTESLTIPELEYGLKQAIAQGLELAIFNSCDGLGLAANLADLHIPQMIIMREPVPDRVAQEFLKYFLEAFSGGKSLMAAVRQAREKLQGIEDEFPCASWLPVIFQNPAEVPRTWEEFRRI